jgi:hypothetical protein
LLLHLPDVVERAFDVAHEHEHGIEHEDKSDAEKDAALGVDKIAVDELDDDVGGCDLSASRNHTSIYLLYPKPRAMANTTAMMGTMASSVE